EGGPTTPSSLRAGCFQAPEMKVAFINQSAQLGGAERSLIDLIVSLRASDPAARFSLILGAEGPLIEEASRLGVQTRLLPAPEVLARLGDSALSFAGRAEALARLALRAPAAGLAAVRYARGLGRFLREVRPDLIHTNDNKSHALACLSRIEGVPIVWHVRDFVTSRGATSKVLRLASAR